MPWKNSASTSTIAGLHNQAKAEGRRLSPEEKALITSLRRRTFKMWEDEVARCAAGETPSFHVRPSAADSRG